MPVPLFLLGGGLAITGGFALLRARKKSGKESSKSSLIKKTRLMTAVVSHRLLSRKPGQVINRHLIVSGIALATTASARLFSYPLLSFISVPLILYSAISIFSETLDGLINERKLRYSVIDSLAIVGTLASGYYFAAAFMSGLHFLGQKLLIKTENPPHTPIKIYPDKVWLWQKGAEVEVSYNSLKAGDLIVVNAGDVIPVDGRIKAGVATIDEHMLTGQAQPQDKIIGDAVLATTLLTAGKLRIQVKKTGEDTVVAQINELLLNTTDFKLSMEARSVEVADMLTWSTLVLGGVALGTLGPLSAVKIVNSNFSDILLVIPPLGVLHYQKLADQQGILVKDGRSLELLNQVDTVVFAKTRTLILEQPEVKFIHSWREVDDQAILSLAAAAAAEQQKSHPVARAIQQAAVAAGLKLPGTDKTAYEAGSGIIKEVDGKTVHVGSSGFMAMESIELPKAAEQIEKECDLNGNTLVYVAIDGDISGAVELQASMRPEASDLVRALRKRGLEIYIMSGDHDEPTRKVAEALAIPDYFADMQPESKARQIERLQEEGRSVCFIGSGINDTIAMKKAQVSISLSGASAAAINTANIVMAEDNLEKLDCLFAFARDFEKDMRANITLALGPGVLSIAGIFLFRLSIYSTMSIYAAALGVGVITTALPWFRTQKLTAITDCNNKQKK